MIGRADAGAIPTTAATFLWEVCGPPASWGSSSGGSWFFIRVLTMVCLSSSSLYLPKNVD